MDYFDKCMGGQHKRGQMPMFPTAPLNRKQMLMLTLNLFVLLIA